MALVLLGINHNTADIDLREKVAFPPESVLEAIVQVRALDRVSEVIIVSTCNRTELYVDLVIDEDPATPSEAENYQHLLLNWLGAYHGIDAQELRKCIYFRWREDVIRHMMRVACGLDSMVLGEPQILGQIKAALRLAQEAGTAGRAGRAGRPRCRSREAGRARPGRRSHPRRHLAAAPAIPRGRGCAPSVRPETRCRATAPTARSRWRSTRLLSRSRLACR